VAVTGTGPVDDEDGPLNDDDGTVDDDDGTVDASADSELSLSARGDRSESD